jgi:hypothetical protein
MKGSSITILMPAYNAERYIAESIRSTLAQTFDDFELLVTDPRTARMRRRPPFPIRGFDCIVGVKIGGWFLPSTRDWKWPGHPLWPDRMPMIYAIPDGWPSSSATWIQIQGWMPLRHPHCLLMKMDATGDAFVFHRPLRNWGGISVSAIPSPTAP